MISRCCQWVLVVTGVAMLAAAVLPFVVLLHIPEPYATELVAAKLIMLPLGAICVLAATAIGARIRR